MQRICHLLVILASVFVLPVAAQDAVAPVSVDFRVDENGAATFAVPIHLPTGRGDMRPQVGLGYSSQNSHDGALGVGWYLQAGSAITRCRKTPFDDGEVGTVTLTSNDRFCLDGQRLHLVSGSYGASGSSYRLSGQPGTVITAHGGSVSNGPDYFKRITKAKEVTYFGNAFYATGLSSDAAALMKPGNNAVISAWMMSSVEDVMRNYIQYRYTTDNLTGESFLSEIRYSGNHNTNDLPYIRVMFDHVAKAQPRNGYQAGYRMTQSQQLEAIRVLIDEELFRSYHLDYQDPVYANDSLMLLAIQECAPDSNGFSRCKSPISFDWHTVTPANNQYFNPYHITQMPFAANEYAAWSKIFDITGDGIDDLIYLANGAWRYRVGPYFNSEQWLTSLSVDEPQQALMIDVNGDGARELLVVNLTGEWVAVGAGGINYAIGQAAIGVNGLTRVMDVNGDAIEDIVFMHENKIYAYLNEGTMGFSSAVELYAFNDPHTEAQLQAQTHYSAGWLNDSSALDINGDGRSDMVVPTTTAVTQCIRNGQILLEINSGVECSDVGGAWQTHDHKTLDVFVSELTGQGPRLNRLQSWPMPNKGLRIGDFNGDGLSDIAYVITNQWHYRLSNGIDYGAEFSTGLDASDDDLKAATLFIDIDNDGRTDILHADTATRWQIYIAQADITSGGVSFAARGHRSRTDSEVIVGGMLSADMRPDLLIAKDSVWYRYATDAGEITQVIDSYSTSFGVQTTIEYAPLSDSSVYEASNPLAADPDVVLIQGHMPVVKQVNSQVSALDWVSVSYRYGGLIAHKQGLGALGFAWLETRDEQTDVVTRTDYYQSIDSQLHVLNGMPALTEQRLGNALLSRAENQLATQSAHHGGYFGAIATATEYSYQYTSAGQSVLRATQTTSTDYDSYGNVIELEVMEHDSHSSVSKTMTTLNSYSDARFGRLSATTVTRSRSDDATLFERDSTFSYRADGLLISTIVAPDEPDYRLETTYAYDNYGQKIATHVSGISQPNTLPQTRSSSVNYAQNGRFVG